MPAPKRQTKAQKRAEIRRLRDLANTIDAKIPLYKERRPLLAKEARATSKLYRSQADAIERTLL